jgi:KaiC/GvpD/RAD55 family RecA-like ATPase|tara:strand:+ start:4133 stop:5356 length:1224 start_codon:yes stop_codon:yes gene_type:complete
MDIRLLKSLLSFEFYTENKANLTQNLFDDEIQEAYNTIVSAHEKYQHDLSASDIQILWANNNPVATRSDAEAFNDLITEVATVDPISPLIVADVLHGLWQRHIGTKVANMGIELADGNSSAMDRLVGLLDSTREGFMPTDFGDKTTKDIHELLAGVTDDNRWAFNIATLSRHVYGIGAREFGCVFALPETGKTAFLVSICAGPGGFCEQGAKVIYLGNEEDTGRTMLRAIQAHAGLTREQIVANPQKARQKFTDIEDLFDMNEVMDWDLNKIEAYVEKEQPDILIIDQADKVNIGGNFNAGHERLRELYRRLRETAKKFDCAVLAVSQASNDAKGRTRLSGFDMEGSKIGKMAELDLCIGIGKHEAGDVDDSEPDTSRYLTVSKNKLSGWHGTVICNIQPELSRYVE